MFESPPPGDIRDQTLPRNIPGASFYNRYCRGFHSYGPPPLGPGAPPKKETLLSTHESADDYGRTNKANVIIVHVLNTRINMSNSHKHFRVASIAN